MKQFKTLIPAVLLIALVVFSFFLLRPFFLAIFLGALFAYVVHPLFERLTKKISSRSLVAFLLCSLTFLVLIIPFTFFVRALVAQSYGFYVLAQQQLQTNLFANCSHHLCQSLAQITDGLQLNQMIGNATSWIIQRGTQFLVSLPKVIVSLFVMLFTMFYFLRDGKKLISQLNHYFHLPASSYKRIMTRLSEIVRGVVYGYVIVALIQGTLGAIGFALFGVSSPIFWGMVMAFLALIPYLGAGAIWVPASLLLIFQGVTGNSQSLLIKGIGLFVYSLIFVSSLDNVIRPFFMGDKARVHPAIILLGIFGGLFLLGPIGVIVGPLVLAITLVALDQALVVKRAGRTQ